MPTVTMLYAGLLGLILLGLAFAAGRTRGRLKVSLGDGGHVELLLAMRRHANFVEYVPVILVLMALLEMNGVTRTAIHAMGISLVIARLAHAAGLSADTTGGAGRAVGAGVTALILLVASIWAVVAFF